MGVISRMFHKQAQLSFLREADAFVLVSFYDGKETALNTVVEKWPELSEVIRYATVPNASRNPVPVAMVEQVRAFLHSLQDACKSSKKIGIYIPSEVEQVQICQTTPEGFEIQYRQQGTQMIRVLPDDVKELADGWLCRDALFWRYDQLAPADQEQFRRSVIPTEGLIRFLSKELPLYRQAGVPIKSDLEYASSPAVTLEMRSFGEDRAEIVTVWHLLSEQINDTFQLDGYVEANHVIQPGVRPAVLHTFFPEETSVLEGSRLAFFLEKHYPLLKKWFSTDLTSFEMAHQWVEPPYHWELVVRSELNGGIGKAYAHPVACIGKDRFSPGELREMLQMPYVRVSTGWVRKEHLLTLGMNEEGKATGGMPLTPIPLQTKQLLYRGGQELGSYWTALTCEGVSWESTGNKHTCARKHLEYLLYWGISGGLVGGYEAMTAYGIPLLSWLGKNSKGCKVLVMGRREDVCALKETYGTFLERLMAEQGFVCLDHDAVFHDADVRNRQWDLLILIEPDEFTHPAEKERLLALKKIKARCKVGFFSKALDGQSAQWDALMLGCPEQSDLMTYLIRDCRVPQKLPQAYAFHPSPMRAAASVATTTIPERNVVFRKMQDGSAETILSGREREGVSIPAREATPEIQIAVGLDLTGRRNEAFFKEARQKATYEGPPTEHIPFFCYWPTYSDMDAAQQKWYFYLRSCLRRGEFPQTDLSYLYVYVYELLNLIGVEDAAEGLKRLSAVRQAYGKQYPQLQNHLASWIYDFVHVYDCGVTVQEILGELQELPEAGLNELLTNMSEQESFDLPLWVLERLSTYKMTNSKFYQRGNQELIARCIPGALHEIDQQLRKNKGKNLLNTYAALKIHTDTFPAFNSAVCEKQRVYALRCRHYHNGLKLSSFLKNVIRYTENALRAQMKYSAKLQGIELDEQTRAWIDAYMAEQAKSSAPKGDKTASVPASAKNDVKIALDLDRLAQLRTDSDDVREMLLATVDNPPAVEENMERPAQIEEGLLTDLDAVQAVLTQMTSEARAMLSHLVEHGWQCSVNALKAAFPNSFPEILVDEINEAAMARMGCFLIEREEDVYIIAEDYRDELEYLIPREQRTSIWQVMLDDAQNDVQNDAQEEWKAFFAQVDMELIGHLLEGMESFRACIKARGEMPEPCLEEINNAAMETLGDLLVTEDGIAEEYLPAVQQYVKKG